MKPTLSGLRNLACIFLFRILVAVIVAVALSAAPAVAQSEQPETPEIFGKLYHCNPGPWGDLQYYYIYLEAPDRVVEHLMRPDPAPRWNFPGGTDATLRALFERAGLPGALQDYLLASEHQVLKDNVLTVFPPLPDLMAMTSEQRTVIYTELAKSEFNMMHVYPACIFDGDVDSWLAQSQLRPELCDAVKKMTYMRGDTLCFSDVAAILGMVESEKEANDFMKTMSRTRSLVLQLNVKNRSDFEQAVRYWSANQRNEDIASIILPAPDTQGSQRLDCIHLLPSLARRNLYSYPSEELAISADLPDCNWTSFNFFSSTPLNYPNDDRLFHLRLTEDYDMVEPPYSFGDVLMFLTPEDIPLHSCVYLADDIVYTKNGRNRASPWLLSKLGDVQRRYSYVQQFSIQGYRLKTQQDQADD